MQEGRLEYQHATDTKTKRRTDLTVTTFSLRKRTRIGTYNIRTLNDPTKTTQIVNEFCRLKLELLGLCEHRLADRGEMKLKAGNANEQVAMIFSGKPNTEIRSSGVALIMSSHARKALMEWHAVSDRILIARFRTRARPVTVVQLYAPTENEEENVKEIFYSQLASTMRKIKKGDIKIVMGDLNAKVGSDNTHREHIMGKEGVGTRNDNGERFVDFCTDEDLVIGGTLFKHQLSHKVTWYSPDGITRNQIDHITISRKWRRSLLDVRVYRSADVYTDHKLLIGTIQLKLAAIKRTSVPLRRTIDPRRLQNPQHMVSFKKKVHDSLELQQPCDPIERWNSLKGILQKAGEEIIPRIPERRKCYISDGTWDLIKQRKAINDSLNAASTQIEQKRLSESYHAKEREVKKSARKDRRAWYNSLADQAEQAAKNNQTRELYRLTRQIAGQSSVSVEKPVKDDEGNDITDEALQLEQWTRHFRQVLNVPSNNPPLNSHSEANEAKIPQDDQAIDADCPSLEEVISAVKNLKKGKAPGPDGLYIELFKADVDLVASHLHPIIESMWELGEIPSQMKEALIIKLPKKGDLSLRKNWRGIALQNSINKIIAKIILDRISPVVEPRLRKEQAGFRRGKSCTDQINTLRIIVEQCQELNASLCLLFIDFERAFDSLDQEVMWQILTRYGIPEKLVQLIRELYDEAYLKVVHKEQVGAGFKVTSGVKQGCVLSPLIFNIILDFVLRLATKKAGGIQWTPFIKLLDLDYADDIVAMTHTMSEMKNFLSDLVKCASIVGLRINVGKTKLMRINPPMRTTRSTSQIPQSLEIDGVAVEEVNEFTYLGSVIATDGGTEFDVRRRITLANVAFGSLRNIWYSKRLTLKLKLKIYQSNVLSVLLYGCETWRVVQSLTSKLQVFVNKCLRKICGIFFPERISNDELHSRTKQRLVGDIIRQRKWRWIGHTLRKPPDDICRRALNWNPPGQRSRGRPKNTWQLSVRSEALQQGINWSEMPSLAENRPEFERFVNAQRFN